jgi:predicted unusual protein kinase regulating ubiquinone biosynthesis (AarF/ABC1/UbiB family)
MVSSKLPTGRLARVASLAKLGLRTGASLIASKDGQGAADQAALVLGQMRGLAAKLGQMAGYVDGFVPEAHRESYEKALGQLQAATPHSAPAAVQATLESEFGGTASALFAEFEITPFASASIGQVHRARLHDGRAVAVKVQHPGVAEAVDSDLQNAHILPALIGKLAGRAFDTRAVFEEVAQRFRDELDYEKEAAQQEWFRAFHANDPLIRIPRVVTERSARRVLTTELAEGVHLDVASQASEALRRRYCEVLWRFVQRGNLIGERFNADPHPGNYLFQPDGGVVFLDFGCVQPLAPTVAAAARAMHVAAARHDEPGFRQAAVRLLGTEGGAYEQWMLEHSRQSFAPLLRSPFRVDRPYVVSLVEAIPAMKRQLFAGDGSFRMLPPTLALLMRLQFGFYSVLARLDAQVDYAAVDRSFLPELADP